MLLFILTLLGVVQECLGGCQFPSFLQSRSASQQRREWHSHIEENSRESATKYSTITNFYGHVMRTTIFGGKANPHTPNPFTRDCILEISPGYFLCSHKDKDDEKGRFLCVSFVQRSPDVMQMKESHMSDLEDPNLCNDEHFTMNKWPYINKANFFSSFNECHLHGGYSMKMLDKKHKKGVCDANDGETRLESECFEGDGISFRFRHSNCVPKGLQMHKNQQTYCMASWQHGSHTFSVLRSDKTDHVWCFIYPSVRGPMFKAYLFRDLYCETDPYPWDGKNYIIIDLQQDPPRSLNDLCVDDYEACEYWTQPCRIAGSVQQLTCAKTCGICNDKRPEFCTLPPQFQGNWVAKDDNHKHKITIIDKVLSFQSYSDLRCVQWDPRLLFVEETTYMEQMFVTTFDNGCRPRYSCVQFKKHSPSILRYRLSEHQLWPFDNTNGITVDCSNFNYKAPINPINHYRSRHFQTIISETERIYVDCKLEETKGFDAIYDDGTKCEGELTQKGLSTQNKMKLILKNCPGRQAEQEFACLDSSKHGYLSEQLVVTETLDSFNRIRCWLFPVHPDLTFYLLPIEECNEGANEKISTGNIRPLATFHEQPKLKLSIIVENAIETKPNHAMAPYLTKDGQNWGEEEEDHYHEEYHDGKNTKVDQQRDPIDSDSVSGGVGIVQMCATYIALCSLLSASLIL